MPGRGRGVHRLVLEEAESNGVPFKPVGRGLPLVGLGNEDNKNGSPFWQKGFQQFLQSQGGDEENGVQETVGNGRKEEDQVDRVQVREKKGGEKENGCGRGAEELNGSRFEGDDGKNYKNGEESKKDVRRVYDDKESRQKRREEMLATQKQRRDDLLDKIRALEDSFTDSDLEEDEDFGEIMKQDKQEMKKEKHHDVEMDTTSWRSSDKGSWRSSDDRGRRKPLYRRPKKNRTAPCRVMLSEWLVEKPDDFEDKWMGVFCPMGKRCLVVASRGKTCVFSRRNEYLGSFQSLLPGGHHVDYRDTDIGQKKGVTIVDCIWSREVECFYILDLVCWRSQSYHNCDKAFRQYFQTSKVIEGPELMQKTPLNPYPFLPLPAFECDQLSEVMMKSLPIFKQKVDGVLFFHKDSFYNGGPNPLALWLYLTDVEEKLQISVSPDLLAYQQNHAERARRQGKPTERQTKPMEQ